MRIPSQEVLLSTETPEQVGFLHAEEAPSPRPVARGPPLMLSAAITEAND